MLTEIINGQTVHEILSSNDSFAKLPEAACHALAKIASRVSLLANTKIIDKGGESDKIYLIVHGRVRMVGLTSGSGVTVNLEAGRGEFLLLLTTLSEMPAQAMLYTLRDTQVLSFQRTELLALIASYPDFLKCYSKFVTDIFLRSHGLGKVRNRPKLYMLIKTTASPEILNATKMLYQSLLNTIGKGELIDSQSLKTILGKIPTEANEFEQRRDDLVRWVAIHETESDFLLLVCNIDESNWVHWCMQQADRIQVITHALDTEEIERIESVFSNQQIAEVQIKTDLILLHKADTAQPTNTRQWLKLSCLKNYHHVREDNLQDFASVARRIGERAVGVVLGGGGARGLAHIGVLQALQDSDIPIDFIAGTSMGSVMAAAHAQSWTPKRLLETTKKLLLNSRSVMDLDFPMISLLSGNKLDTILKKIFGDTDITDLWTPFFCISSSLTAGKMVIHQQGKVWKCVRASCSLPGIFPPVLEDDHLLVDGGILNNVPMDIMSAKCVGGTVIAVDVGGGGALGIKPNDKKTTGWSILGNRVNPFASNAPINNIFQILMWATTLSSDQYLNQLIKSGKVDLFIKPPVQQFQLLDFSACQPLYKIGYDYTMQQISDYYCHTGHNKPT